MTATVTHHKRSTSLLARASKILGLLAEQDTLTAAQIASRAGESRSSIYRTLNNMAEVGWICAGDLPGTWRMSLQLFGMSSAAIRRLDICRIARPHLLRLHQTTELTTFLCVRHEWVATCIDRIEGLKVDMLALRLGGSLPLHVGAAPQALLAFEEPNVWRRWAEHIAVTEPFSDFSKPSAEEVFERMTTIRSHGYALSDEDVTSGITSLGVPIFDYSNNVKAAISISGMRNQIYEHVPHPGSPSSFYLDSLITTGQSISSALGYRGEIHNLTTNFQGKAL